MKIGIPKEIKNNEFRVAITPFGVKELISHGHEVFIEKNAGINSSFLDKDYKNEGAIILDDNKSIFDISILFYQEELLLTSFDYLFYRCLYNSLNT